MRFIKSLAVAFLLGTLNVYYLFEFSSIFRLSICVFSRLADFRVTNFLLIFNFVEFISFLVSFALLINVQCLTNFVLGDLHFFLRRLANFHLLGSFLKSSVLVVSRRTLLINLNDLIGLKSRILASRRVFFLLFLFLNFSILLDWTLVFGRGLGLFFLFSSSVFCTAH